MAIPSSPPPMPQDIPSSPPLPPLPSVNLKRPLADYDSLSSDPIFSEDASESDEYTGRKHKRLFKGPWWRHSPAGYETRTQRKRSKAALFADSGVWLGSEASDDSIAQSEDSLPNFEPSWSQRQVPRYRPDAVKPARSAPTADQLAQRIVLECVDNGREMVDLSYVHQPPCSTYLISNQ